MEVVDLVRGEEARVDLGRGPSLLPAPLALVAARAGLPSERVDVFGAGLLIPRSGIPVATLARVTTPSAIRLAPPTTTEPLNETAFPARDPTCLAACSVAVATPVEASVPIRCTVAPNEERPPRIRRTSPNPASPIPKAMVSSSSIQKAYRGELCLAEGW